jgi:diacylglycerol kinase (ATP)
MDGRKHIVFVVHGDRAGRPDFRHLVSWVRRRGHHVEIRVTWEAGDAALFAAQGSDRGADVVVAVGGDGTLNEVINGLDGRDTAVGIIPLGTANDLARQLAIPADADHAMDVVLQRPPVRIDSASLNGRRFVNVSTGGLGAEATAETPKSAKASLGPLAYAITGVRKLPALAPYEGTFRGDGFDLSGEFLLFAVGNGRATGAGTPLTPNASITDGLLDVCVFESMARMDLPRLLLQVKRGEHYGHPGVHYARTSWLQLTTTAPLAVNVDGEHQTLDRLEYRVRPADLRIHCVSLPGEEG